jgi:hypothetical protein
MSETHDQEDLIVSVQEQMDRILSGKIEVEWQIEDRRPFTGFLPSDRHDASRLAARWAAIADERRGVEGLADAATAIQGSLGTYRPGLVEYSALLFLTHHREARSHIVLRSLEERQPGLIAPSLVYADPEIL